MKDLDTLIYFTAAKYFKKNGFKNSENIKINNESFHPNFSDGGIRNMADSGGLPITLRTSTLRSRTLIKTDKKRWCTFKDYKKI
ncbi:hypothetical protein EII29_04565 [Leptotrichia sp. OH3620_COT-345]|uniref:hypothetical protein n=1 Tax=Leptotrichia sp. OH3620_COT-345 TaxID=2491048 RepID=UPI000F64E485|nr:hypothetical protein [Leptotrichia sp. OH3620_COT-345]RRD40085.1 hypothetical protein EII29_04565 [Leptotrichia sp. OH3620_COT-345]